MVWRELCFAIRGGIVVSRCPQSFVGSAASADANASKEFVSFLQEDDALSFECPNESLKRAGLRCARASLEVDDRLRCDLRLVPEIDLLPRQQPARRSALCRGKCHAIANLADITCRVCGAQHITAKQKCRLETVECLSICSNCTPCSRNCRRSV
jgi:hypothetical protein